MDVSRRRGGVKTSVVAGSVWESRMKLDEVKGGIKVFNGTEETNSINTTNQENTNEGDSTERKMAKKFSSVAGASGKRKTWKSESSEGPLNIARGKTEAIKNASEEQLSSSLDGVKGSPIQVKKVGRSDGANKELNTSTESFVKSPIQSKKVRSDSDEKNQVLSRKSRSDFKTKIDSPKPVKDSADSSDKSSAQLGKLKSEQVSEKVVESEKSTTSNKNDNGEKNPPEAEVKSTTSNKNHDGEKNPPEVEDNGSDQTCKDFGVCQEKVVSTTQKLNTDNDVVIDEDDDDEDNICDDEELEYEEELEEEIEVEVEKRSVDVIKDININQEEKPKPKSVEISNVMSEELEDNKKVVTGEKKVYEFRNRTAPPTPSNSSTSNHKQPPPVLRRATIYQNLSKPTSVPVSSEYQSFPQTHSKLQNLVDLVMWREISRSAFLFGIGTFIIISSSYTQDLNVSFISVTSYLGLIYLAAIFLYRSLICRGVIDMEDDGRSHVLGEGEAIWLLKLVLPYLNECLLKIRALFSGDPATTMKMAVIMFVFARCGNSITIWKMAKLGFFGVFIIPKVCSSYSSQLTGFAKFWIRRFRDAWESCTHKKAVALAVFTLVWNLSSMVARVWAVFMMFVAVRYYQQTMETEDWVVEEEEEDENVQEEQPISSLPLNKLKKGF